MKIGIASGKGGTGKTTVATSLANLLKEEYQVLLLDCDVEEPNAHLFLKPVFKKDIPVLVKVPEINREKCSFCSRCSEVCAFGALAVLESKVIFHSHLCHSCGACAYFCPQKAITEVTRRVGIVQEGSYKNMQFVHGILEVGEAMAPPVINEVKKYQDDARLTIIDIPPGTSCSVVASLKDIDFCIVVTEPTPFGLNDMVLLIELLKEMKISFAVVINRADLGDKGLENFCREEKIPVLLKIPFDKEAAGLNAEGISLIEKIPWWRDSFNSLWLKVKEMQIS